MRRRIPLTVQKAQYAACMAKFEEKSQPDLSITNRTRLWKNHNLQLEAIISEQFDLQQV